MFCSSSLIYHYLGKGIPRTSLASWTLSPYSRIQDCRRLNTKNRVYGAQLYVYTCAIAAWEGNRVARVNAETRPILDGIIIMIIYKSKHTRQLPPARKYYATTIIHAFPYIIIIQSLPSWPFDFCSSAYYIGRYYNNYFTFTTPTSVGIKCTYPLKYSFFFQIKCLQNIQWCLFKFAFRSYRQKTNKHKTK